MLRPIKQVATRPRTLALSIAASAGIAITAFAGVALARTLTLQVARHAQVTNTLGMSSSQNIVINARGKAVYELSGDSAVHPKCTRQNGCFQFWPPVTVASAKKLSKASGIRGKLGVWTRNGFHQVTLAGHPLYTFAEDRVTHVATGQGLKTFHGTWHVIPASIPPSGPSTTLPSTTPTPTTTTVMTPCLYPPCS